MADTRFKKGSIPHNAGKLGYTNKGSFQKGHKLLNNALEEWRKEGGIVWNKGVKVATNTGRTHFKKGLVPWNKGKTYKSPQISESNKGKHYSLDTEFKKGHNISPDTEFRKGHNKAKRGEQSHFWKGGITPIHKKIRTSREYREWRESVFCRDNYTCVLCGKKGGNIQADHIKPFSLYPELRLMIDNGRTMCIDCHKSTETFGGKMNRKIMYV